MIIQIFKLLTFILNDAFIIVDIDLFYCICLIFYTDLCLLSLVIILYIMFF